MTDCPSENLLQELASGRLEPTQAASLHEHIDSCSSCLHAVAELLRSEGSEPTLYPARYRMIEESARGGQARVLRGYDALTQREVAIKELLPQEDPSDKVLRRFVHEARLTASLTHPGIVPVFDIGFREDGRPFYTMQFVRGRTLAQALRACGSPAERLRTLSHFLELCQAVSFAHSRGIVHRDIKPHNVVVGEFGQTMLIDWGLAKRTRAAAEPPAAASASSDGDGEVARAPDATVSGSVIGTPAYMSPEQASGRLEDVDERSDVFGLGAVLYEILTGRAPHAGSKVTELLHAARTASAPPVGPDAPRELAVIAHKALALDRAERYERAADLARDVEAFMTGGRVGVYEYSSWELLRRLVTRHKRTVAAAALGLAALVAALAALAVAFRREDHQRRRAEASGAETMIEGAQTALAHRDVLAARARLRSALEINDSLEARSLWRQLSVDPLVWQVRIGSQPSSIAFSAARRRFAVAGYLPGVRLIDLDTGVVEVLPTDQVSRLAFAADGITAIDLTGHVQRWDLATRRARDLGSVGDTIRTMVQTADERVLYVLTGGGRLVRVDTTARATTEIPLSQAPGFNLALRPDGKALALVMETGELRVLDLAAGGETPLDCPRRKLMAPAYSPDGGLLAAVGAEGKICLFSGTAAPPRIIDGLAPGGAIVFSPDGRRFAVGGADGRVRIWETATGKLLTSVREGEAAGARAPTWTGDGTAVAALYNEGVVRLFSTEMPAPEAGAGAVSPGVLTSLAVSPDGETIVTGGEDGRLRFFDLASGSERLSVRAHQTEVMAVAYAPDGRVATGGSDGTLRIWDREGRPQKTLAGPSAIITAVSFAGSGQVVSSGGGYHTWDVETGALRHSIAVPGAGGTPAVAGDELALGHADGSISRRQLSTGRELEHVSLGHGAIDRIGHVDGGRGIAAVSDHGDVLVRDAAGSVMNLGQLDCTPEGCLLATDAQGGRLAVVQNHRRIAVWDLATQRRTDFQGDAFQGVTFTPDGKLLAGLSPHGVLQVWDAEAGRPRWRGPLLREGSDEVYTHRGWASLSGPTAGGPAAWRRAVETDAWIASESGDLLCLATFDGALEIWSQARDVRLARVEVGGLDDLRATGRGCVVLTRSAASLLDPRGKMETLAPEARSIFVRGETVLIGLDDRVVTPGGTEEVDPGLSAIALHGDGDLLAGYHHGGIQLRHRGRVLALADTPSATVLKMVAGPPSLVAASFTDGTVGLWSAETGQLLQRWWLHGFTTHLALRGTRLLALTDVGQVAAWDVQAYSRTYCQLLQEVWRAVPVVWAGGRPVLERPPAGHPCTAGPHKDR